MEKSRIEKIVEESNYYEYGKCPCCGGKMDKELVMNALSRYADVYICNSCGTNEALKEIENQEFTLNIGQYFNKWHVVENKVE